MKTDALIHVGLHHLARFALLHSRQPVPLLARRSKAAGATSVHPAPASRRGAGLRHLAELPLGSPAPRRSEWGCVPRNVQLVTKEGQPKAGVADVHAFLQAPLFWWLASILWCLTAGRTLDPLLDDEIMGYRLHPGFVEEPGQRGLMFRDYKTAHKSWEALRFDNLEGVSWPVWPPTRLTSGTSTTSRHCAPEHNRLALPEGEGKRWRRGQRAHTLTQLLDVMHARYTARCREIKPRPFLTEASSPLPARFPSSRIMANFIVDLARGDLVTLPHIEGVAAYADDLPDDSGAPGDDGKHGRVPVPARADPGRFRAHPEQPGGKRSCRSSRRSGEVVTLHSRSSEADEEDPDDEQTVRRGPQSGPIYREPSGSGLGRETPDGSTGTPSA